MDLRELMFFLLIQVLYLYPNPIEEMETIKMMMEAVVGQTITVLVVMKVVLEKMVELEQYVVKEKKDGAGGDGGGGHNKRRERSNDRKN